MAISRQHNIEPSDILLLVAYGRNMSAPYVVNESTFIRYMTANTRRFFPHVPAHATYDQWRFDGYVWFSQFLPVLAGDHDSIQDWLTNATGNLLNYDFGHDCCDDQLELSYAFLPAAAIHPNLLVGMKINYLDLQVNPEPQISSASPGLSESVRPIWLL